MTSKGGTLPLTNFVARFNPASETGFLFLAQWDSRPRADGTNSTNSTVPVPGANDGVSGVALLLGVTDVIQRTPPTVGCTCSSWTAMTTGISPRPRPTC